MIFLWRSKVLFVKDKKVIFFTLSKNNKFFVQSGAGIVAHSKPINEFNETVNKAKALIKALE